MQWEQVHSCDITFRGWGGVSEAALADCTDTSTHQGTGIKSNNVQAYNMGTYLLRPNYSPVLMFPFTSSDLFF